MDEFKEYAWPWLFITTIVLLGFVVFLISTNSQSGAARQQKLAVACINAHEQWEWQPTSAESNVYHDGGYNEATQSGAWVCVK